MNDGIDYKKAGVDIDTGEAVVERIKGFARSTFRPEVLHGPGGFGGLFAPCFDKIEEPVLVAGCDGVGTKLKVAFAANRHDTIGIDCVAMCVNDILVQGAAPLFFLDYLAVGKLDPEQAETIVSGIAEGCRQAGCALLGGETAEMPGFYASGEYDLAGFAVGLVDRSKIVDGASIAKGDAVVGIASAGLHSNGYALARKVLLEEANLDLNDYQPVFQAPLADELLKPTTIYVRPILEALKKYKIRGMAHITGGGIPGNLPRILPSGLDAEIYTGSWPVPPVFQLIADLGAVNSSEMFRVFNMGIGMMIVIAPDDADSLIKHFDLFQLKSYQIGTIKAGAKMVNITSI
jgi:phosphoribosylformylglycinamidine cyclo-ligase